MLAVSSAWLGASVEGLVGLAAAGVGRPQMPPFAAMAPDPDGPERSETAAADTGPVLALLCRGLEFWVRQQCQAVESLQIHLEGSALQLLRGRLEGVRVEARGVRYQDLELEEVRLRGEAVRVRMGSLLRRQTLELENPFVVRGAILFSGEGLNRSLAHPNWSWLGDEMAEALLGIRPLAGVRFEANQLILRAQPAGPADRPVERAAELMARDGTVAVSAVGEDLAMALPMDPGIQIETASLAAGLLELMGRATIQP